MPNQGLNMPNQGLNMPNQELNALLGSARAMLRKSYLGLDELAGMYLLNRDNAAASSYSQTALKEISAKCDCLLWGCNMAEAVSNRPRYQSLKTVVEMRTSISSLHGYGRVLLTAAESGSFGGEEGECKLDSQLKLLGRYVDKVGAMQWFCNAMGRDIEFYPQKHNGLRSLSNHFLQSYAQFRKHPLLVAEIRIQEDTAKALDFASKLMREYH